jgi:hypothetical protein
VVEEGYNCDGNTKVDAAELVPQPNFTSGVFPLQQPTSVDSDLSLAKTGAVAFMSSLALTPQAVPGRPVTASLLTQNIYEYREGQVYLISPADEAAPANIRTRLAGIDASGNDVFFASTDALVPQHTDTQVGLYDARVKGGFPGPIVPNGCEGEACEGPLPAAPVAAAPASNVVGPSGNLVAPAPAVAQKPKPKSKKCKKGFTRKHGRCVKSKVKKDNDHGRSK